MSPTKRSDDADPAPANKRKTGAPLADWTSITEDVRAVLKAAQLPVRSDLEHRYLTALVILVALEGYDVWMASLKFATGPRGDVKIGELEMDATNAIFAVRGEPVTRKLWESVKQKRKTGAARH